MLYNSNKATLSGDRIDEIHSSEESFKVPFENTVGDFDQAKRKFDPVCDAFIAESCNGLSV